MFDDAAIARGINPGSASEPITMDPARAAIAAPRRRNDVLFTGSTS
jgi:hypothetical protein